nr:MAG TPA: hypothetical protein [Caudoviricetes sp.]
MTISLYHLPYPINETRLQRNFSLFTPYLPKRQAVNK